MGVMIPLLRRDFTVDLPLERAWRQLAQVERWPSWARHIKRARLEPPGQLTAQSVGLFHLNLGMKTAFHMTQFDPPRHWTWEGRFLWLTIRYDHVFTELATTQTKLTWIVSAEGFAVSFVGKLFAKAYAMNLDKAIPALVAEMNRQTDTFS